MTLKNTILMCVYIINNGNANGCLIAIVSNPFKESFYGKKEKKKKAINVLTAFFISIKSDIKTFLKWIVNHCPKVIH